MGVVPGVLLGLATAGVALLIGFFQWRGYSLALTFNIFLQGFNVITRLMMFFSQTVAQGGQVQGLYLVLSVLSIGLSLWVLLRLDRMDVHALMTR